MKEVVLDQIDRQILNKLLQNGRASYSSIGAEVGLSPHGAANRVRRMVETGVITGFRADVNLGSLGNAIDAIIDVRLLPGITPAEFEARAARLHAIRELVFMTGRFDYQLRAACHNTDHLNEAVRALRGPAIGAHTETRIVLGSTTYDRTIN